jgi:hypothetical protein
MPLDSVPTLEKNEPAMQTIKRLVSADSKQVAA